MYEQESVFENEAHKILWDFEIKTDHRWTINEGLVDI